MMTRLVVLAGFQGIKHITGVAPQMAGLYALPFAVLSLIFLWPNFALLFKRFHDAGLTGLPTLLYFTPLLYAVYGGYASFVALHNHDVAALRQAAPPYLAWILISINYGLVAIAVLLPAGKVTNRFGPRPGYLPDEAQDVF